MSRDFTSTKGIVVITSDSQESINELINILNSFCNEANEYLYMLIDKESCQKVETTVPYRTACSYSFAGKSWRGYRKDLLDLFQTMLKNFTTRSQKYILENPYWKFEFLYMDCCWETMNLTTDEKTVEHDEYSSLAGLKITGHFYDSTFATIYCVIRNGFAKNIPEAINHLDLLNPIKLRSDYERQSFVAASYSYLLDDYVAENSNITREKAADILTKKYESVAKLKTIYENYMDNL